MNKAPEFLVQQILSAVYGYAQSRSLRLKTGIDLLKESEDYLNRIKSLLNELKEQDEPS